MHGFNRRFVLSCGSALLLLQLSCGREITGPANGVGGRVAHIALDPKMPFIDSLFETANGISNVVPFNRVRITAARQSEIQVPSSPLAYDRTIPFPSTADSIALNLSIPLGEGDTEGVGLAVRIAYINTQGDTIFRGGPVFAFATPGSSRESISMPIRYTGVGSEATSVVMSPDTGTAIAGTSTVFTAEARDTSGVIAGTPLYFYSPDTARARITNPAIGAVQWKPSRGTARIIVLHPDGQLADTSTFNVTLPATKLVVASGNAQSSPAGTALAQPIVVRTLASDNVPVPGVIVTFAISSGGGALTVLTDTSDANGTVSTSWTLGTAIGSQSITASAAGLSPAPLTISATSLSGPTGFALNITSPVAAKRYYAVVTGGGLASEVVQKIDPLFARTATMNIPLAAGTGYSIYVLAVDSLATLPDTIPLIAAGMKLANLAIPAGNTVAVNVTLQPLSLVGTVPSAVNAGEPFVGDVTLTDPSQLFYELANGIPFFRSDGPPNADRTGGSVVVGGMQVLNATQKRYTASVFRPTNVGTIYGQYSAGIITSDRKYVFVVIGPSLQRNEALLTTSVAAAAAGMRVSVTSPVGVTRFVVGVDTGSGPIAWGGATGVGLTSATIDIPVPVGANYRVRVAALDDFGFSTLTNANLAGLRAGGLATGVAVSATGVTTLPITLALQTTAAGVPSTGTSGSGITYSGTMRDPSLFNATTGCLMRYSTAGPIVGANLGTLLTTGCTVSNRQTDGTYTVTGSFPPITGPNTLHTHVFTSVIGYQANGARVELVHQNIAITTITAP